MNKITSIPIRETFGIIDPSTSQPYTDIVKASIQIRTFNKLDRHKETLSYRERYYQLQMDTLLLSKLSSLFECEKVDVIVSFQQRTDFNIAIARLYRPELDKRTNNRVRTERNFNG